MDWLARRTLGRERRMGASRWSDGTAFSWEPFKDEWTVGLERLGRRPVHVVAWHVGRGITGRAARTDYQQPTGR